MDMIFSQDFGALGIALVVFILVFTILLMPVGIYVAMKNAAKAAQEQDRRNAQSHKHA